MLVELHPSFIKSYKKRITRNSKLVKQATERIYLFKENPRNPTLKDHALTGKKKSFRAFAITGDIRIVYLPLAPSRVLFLDIGTHGQVY